MARFSYGYFGAPMPPGYTPVGPQYKIGQAGPAGGTVVSITPGPVLQTTRPMPIAPPRSYTLPPPVRPMPFVPPRPPPATSTLPVVETGKSTVIDTNVGPVQVPVVTAPVPAPMLISPAPAAPPVMVVPVDRVPPPAPPPAKAPPPARPPPAPVQPKAPRLVDEDDGGLPPGAYDPDEFFPPEIYPRIPPRAGRADPRARPALTATADEEFDVQDIFVGGGRADEEGRAFPMTRPAQTAARSPSPTGYMPVAPVTPRTVNARAETDGAVLVRVPGARGTPVAPVVPSEPATGGTGLVGVAAGAGAGFVVAGPVGAGVGAVVMFLLGRGK